MTTSNLIYNIIQFGILIIGLLTFYFMLKKDNRKANEEIFSKKLADVEKFNDLERRVKLLEQRVDLYDDQVKKELEAIKHILTELQNRFNKHLVSTH